VERGGDENRMKFLLGKKLYMTQIFNEDGAVQPATVISVPSQVITQIKTKETDGYLAIQLGFGERPEKKISRPQKGHAKNLGSFEGFKEFRVEKIDNFSLGGKVSADIFQAGDQVIVSGISKGKGFQGVVKRHHFSGGSRTHGQKHSEREPGSIGGGGRAGGRVAKGTRMAGRMGGDRVTVKGLKVAKVDVTNSLLYLSGAVPGRKGALLEIRGMSAN
jgi:large subunit ribosomal protein L3